MTLTHPEIIRTNRYGSLVVEHDFAGNIGVYWQAPNGTLTRTGNVQKWWWERDKPYRLRYHTDDGQLFDHPHDAAEHVLNLANDESEAE